MKLRARRAKMIAMMPPAKSAGAHPPRRESMHPAGCDNVPPSSTPGAFGFQGLTRLKVADGSVGRRYNTVGNDSPKRPSRRFGEPVARTLRLCLADARR